MSFYADSSFETELPEDDVHFIGDSVNIKVSWTDDMPKGLPVSFYLSECSVSDEENNFKVLDNGCPESLVETQIQGDRTVLNLLQPFLIDNFSSQGLKLWGVHFETNDIVNNDRT